MGVLMDDRITEIRKALDRWEEWGQGKDAFGRYEQTIPLAVAAREYADLLDSDALIIRRDDPRLRADLEAIWNRGFAGLAWDPAWLDHVVADLASSQGVEPDDA